MKMRQEGKRRRERSGGWADALALPKLDEVSKIKERAAAGQSSSIYTLIENSRVRTDRNTRKTNPFIHSHQAAAPCTSISFNALFLSFSHLSNSSLSLDTRTSLSGCAEPTQRIWYPELACNACFFAVEGVHSAVCSVSPRSSQKRRACRGSNPACASSLKVMAVSDRAIRSEKKIDVPR